MPDDPTPPLGSRLRRAGVFIGCLLGALSPCARADINPAARALIVIGLTADDAQTARFQKQAAALRLAFQSRGIADGAIKLISPSASAPLTRETILSALRQPTPATGETWIVLLGHAAPNRTGQPAFQITGPRLSADEFATALAALAGKKFVIAGTTRSGGFLAPLAALPDVEAVAATADTGEINEPRFATAWAEALTAQPGASFSALATEAAARVEIFYRHKGLAQGEHARLIDPAAKTIIDVVVPPPPAAPSP